MSFLLIVLSTCIVALSLYMVYTDIKTLEVSDSINIIAWLLGCFIGGITHGYSETFIATFTLMGMMTMIRFVLTSFLKKESMGEADILIIGTMGALFGIQGALIALFVASLISLVTLVSLRQFSKPLPFVPFLFLGSIMEPFIEKHFISLIGFSS